MSETYTGNTLAEPDRPPMGIGPQSRQPEETGRYRLNLSRIWLHRLASQLPRAWREPFAERWLRRPDAPGPAAEHALQYLLSAERNQRKAGNHGEATIAKGADGFYAKQYRQTLNATMGAFAMTATQALAASGAAPTGSGWTRHRRAHAALIEARGACPPILVLNDETVALCVTLPRLRREGEAEAIEHWLGQRGRIPAGYRDLIDGERVRCPDRRVRARERSRDGSTLALLQTVLTSRRLALLALHPCDPDAMGLHITLFGVDVLNLRQLASDYAVDTATLGAYRHMAGQDDRLLLFCVGGTEEVFTQCSQNLFIKRPLRPAESGPDCRALPAEPWHSGLPLEHLLARQFEAIQVTVSLSGLPGASPRNGEQGQAVLAGRRNGRLYALVPYYPGNFVHGHAAKLWSNGYSTLVISDDHSSLRRVSLVGPTRIATHREARRLFPFAALGVERDDRPKSLPDYWFVQEVVELIVEREPLSPHRLDPARPTCSINAGGEARHGKKPHYFAADGLPAYDTHWQHQREAAGRPRDDDGASYQRWRSNVASALARRSAHLAELLDDAAPDSAKAETMAEKVGISSLRQAEPETSMADGGTSP